MKRHYNLGAYAGLFFVLLWAAAIGGYIANIVKLIGIINEPFTRLLILRGFGAVVAPLGVILGFF